MAADEKAPYGPQPKTTSLPAVTERALLEDLGRVVRTIADTVGETRRDMHDLTVKVNSTDERLARVEHRLVTLETAPITSIIPSVPPPQLTSGRVRALIEATPSQMDLEHEAKVAGLINWRQEVTDELATKATKKDLETTTIAQTAELVDALKKDPTVQKAIAAVAGAITTAGALITAYLATRGH